MVTLTSWLVLQVADVSTSKTGKHGHAKCHFVAIDIFTGKKYEDLTPSSHNCDVSVGCGWPSLPTIHSHSFCILGIRDLLNAAYIICADPPRQPSRVYFAGCLRGWLCKSTAQATHFRVCSNSCIFRKAHAETAPGHKAHSTKQGIQVQVWLQLSLMDEGGNTKDDLGLPKGTDDAEKLADQIKKDFDDGKELVVTVLKVGSFL